MGRCHLARHVKFFCCHKAFLRCPTLLIGSQCLFKVPKMLKLNSTLRHWSLKNSHVWSLSQDYKTQIGMDRRPIFLSCGIFISLKKKFLRLCLSIQKKEQPQYNHLVTYRSIHSNIAIVSSRVKCMISIVTI